MVRTMLGSQGWTSDDNDEVLKRASGEEGSLVWTRTESRTEEENELEEGPDDNTR